MVKPSAVQYVRYSLGRRLPDELREWVRHDLTCRHAAWRHLLRSLVPFVPVYAGMLLAPLGPLWLRSLCLTLALGETAYYSLSFMPMNRQRRLEQHGYPGDLDQVLRQQRSGFDRARYEQSYRHGE